jgi:hypothetical protein
MDIYATGNEPWFFITEEDAGKFGIELITSSDAENGGFISFCSFKLSLREVADIYSALRGVKVKIVERGTVEELEKKAVEAKEALGRSNFFGWLRLWFQLFTIRGDWNLTDLANAKFPNVKTTTLQNFLEKHQNI